MVYRVEVNLSGAFFEGDADAERRRMLSEMVDDVATEGKNLVVGHLVTFIRRPTPFYWTQVTTERQGVFRSRVHDQRVVYGPWLEGVSRRNRATRFKGYAAFRTSTQKLAARVPELVQPRLETYLGRMS